jgi:hypothetical protein
VVDVREEAPVIKQLSMFDEPAPVVNTRREDDPVPEIEVEIYEPDVDPDIIAIDEPEESEQPWPEPEEDVQPDPAACVPAVEESTDPEQGILFAMPPAWEDKWRGMPEFRQRDLQPWGGITVHFASLEDRQAFARLVEQPISDLTKSLWYPKAQIGRYADKRYVTEEQVVPKYPIYIISKGRWESRLTVRALDEIGVPFRIVVEPQEFDQYAQVIDPARILVLPFSNLGQGSIPARNWVWEHSLAAGDARHWILDDNIRAFFRLHNNLKVPIKTGVPFVACEEFSDRYENVGQSGLNYFMFANRKTAIPPYYLNTRIYSCILNRNDLPHRWRGRYNEDTDLSIRILKDGWCTVLLNAFLAEKATTMTMKGGNTESLYQGNGRLLMAQSLQEQHPDIVTITEKWGRPQHQVNYRPFKRNTLRPKEGVVIPDTPNDFGMMLEMVDDEETST